MCLVCGSGIEFVFLKAVMLVEILELLCLQVELG